MARPVTRRGALVLVSALALALAAPLAACDAVSEEPADEAAGELEALTGGGPWFASYRLVSDAIEEVSGDGAVGGDVAEAPSQVPDDDAEIVTATGEGDAGEGDAEGGADGTGQETEGEDETAELEVVGTGGPELSVSVAVTFESDEGEGLSATLAVARGSEDPEETPCSVVVAEDGTYVSLASGAETPAVISWRDDGTYIISVASDVILGSLASDVSVKGPEGGATALLFTSSADASQAASTVDVATGQVVEGKVPAQSASSYAIDGYELFRPEDSDTWYWRRSATDVTGGE